MSGNPSLPRRRTGLPLKNRRRRNTGWAARSPRDRRHEFQQILIGGIPVDPGDLVVLAVPVVVAALCAAQLVTVADHRNALGQDRGRNQVALLARSQFVDLRVVGGTLYATVPRTVVALAVVVVLSVGLVVFLVVGHQVSQGKAVVRGDEVDRRDRSARGVLVEIGRTGQPGGELTELASSPRQKSRTVSRNLPFHSVHCGGKLPTW